MQRRVLRQVLRQVFGEGGQCGLFGAADVADDGVGPVLLHGLGDSFCVKCVGNGGADVVVGEKFVGLLFGQP